MQYFVDAACSCAMYSTVEVECALPHIQYKVVVVLVDRSKRGGLYSLQLQ